MKKRKIFRAIWNEFIYGGHLQCLGIAGIVYISGFLLNIKINWELLLIAYLIFYPIYLNDRLKWLEPDRSTNPERTEHFDSYHRLMPKIIFLSIALLAVMLINTGNFKFLIFALALLLLGLLYPAYFKNLTKKIVAFKNFYVALFFAAIAFSPVIYYGYPLNIPMLFSLTSLIFLIFFKTVLMQILLDCKDVENDQSLGLLTIPVLIGKEKTLDFLRISSALATILILSASALLIRDFPVQMLILFLVIPFNCYSYYLVQKQNYSGYALASGEFVFWTLLILIASTALI